MRFEPPPQPEPTSRAELAIAMLFLIVCLVILGMIWGGLLDGA